VEEEALEDLGPLFLFVFFLDPAPVPWSPDRLVDELFAVGGTDSVELAADVLGSGTGSGSMNLKLRTLYLNKREETLDTTNEAMIQMTSLAKENINV
jgi:hypothetical protein